MQRNFTLTISTLYIARICAVFCMLGLLSTASGRSLESNIIQHSQLETLPLSEVIDKIAQKYDVNIIYDIEQIKGVYINSFTLGKSVDEDLRLLLKGENFIVKKINTQTFIIKRRKAVKKTSVVKAPAKPIRTSGIDITGAVFDADTKAPLIGATIVIIGTNKGALSLDDGSFSLHVEEGKSLLIKYWGYQNKEVVVDKRNLGNIYLQPSTKNLKEVVVVGYGTQKRSDLTGALSSINEKQLKQLPSTGLDQAIRQRLQSLQFFVKPGVGLFNGTIDIDWISFGDNTVGIKNPEQLQTLRAFPNPMKSQVRVEYTLPEAAKVEVHVSNMMGQRMLIKDMGNQYSGLNSSELNIQQLPTGMYFLQKHTNGKLAGTVRVLK